MSVQAADGVLAGAEKVLAEGWSLLRLQTATSSGERVDVLALHPDDAPGAGARLLLHTCRSNI